MARKGISGVINPGRGNKASKMIFNLNNLQIEEYPSLMDAAEAFRMAPQSLLKSRSMRESRNIRLIGVDCTYSEAVEFKLLVELKKRGFKKVEKVEKAF